MKINEFKNSADKRILNEIKMSVIDEALKKNPRNLSLALLRSVYTLKVAKLSVMNSYNISPYFFL